MQLPQQSIHRSHQSMHQPNGPAFQQPQQAGGSQQHPQLSAEYAEQRHQRIMMLRASQATAAAAYRHHQKFGEVRENGMRENGIDARQSPSSIGPAVKQVGQANSKKRPHPAATSTLTGINMAALPASQQALVKKFRPIVPKQHVQQHRINGNSLDPMQTSPDNMHPHPMYNTYNPQQARPQTVRKAYNTVEGGHLSQPTLNPQTAAGKVPNNYMNQQQHHSEQQSMAAIHHHPYYNQQHVQQPIYGHFAMNGGPAHNMVGSNNQAEMLYANSNTGAGQKINGKMVRQPQQQQYRQAHTNYRPIAQKVVQQQKRAMPVHQQMHQPQNNMRYNNQPSSGMSNMPFSPANDFSGSCAQFVNNSGSATGVDKEMSNIHRYPTTTDMSKVRMQGVRGAGKTPPSQLMYIPSPKLHQQQQQQQSRSNSASPMVLHINSNSDLLGSNQFLNIEPPPILEAEGQLSSMANGNEPCHR